MVDWLIWLMLMCVFNLDGWSFLLASIASPEKAGWFEFPGFAKIPNGLSQVG